MRRLMPHVLLTLLVACPGAGNDHAPRDVARIIQAINSPDTKLARAACDDVARLGRPDHLPALLDVLLKIEDPALRPHAERTAVALALKNPEFATRADAIIAAYPAAPDPAKPSLLRILGHIANAGAYEFLKDIVREGGADPPAETALRALIAWPDTTATALLINQARRMNAADPRRALVVRGALRQMREATATLATQLDPAPPTQLVEWFVKTEQLIRVPEERRQWLAGLADLRHPEALRLVVLHLNDPEVRGEAEPAALEIARNLARGPAGAEAMNLLQSLSKSADNPTIRRHAAEAVSNAR